MGGFGALLVGIGIIVLIYALMQRAKVGRVSAPLFKTGALGHQNSGPGKTGDFNSFKEIVGNARVTHNTNLGTDIDTVSRIRKAKAINALVPTDSPIVDITIRPETK